MFAGGGSGGHVYPTLAVIEALKKHFPELDVPVEMTRVGPNDGYGVLFENKGVEVALIAGAKIRRYFSLSNVIDVPKFFIAIIQAFFKLYFIMPDVIFSKGGTGALPVVLAGAWYRIPIVVHESDAQPGLTNLTSARFAKKVLVSFDRTKNSFDPQKTEVTGTPIRDELLGLRTTKQLAKETIGFSGSDPLVVVLGGSQGSTRINEFLLENLGEVLKLTQVMHQTGVANFVLVQKLSRAVLMDESFKNRYQPINYFEDNMATALNAADLVITRPGSNTLSEIAAFALPAIVIPIKESANDHQRMNAYEFSKNGAAIVIEESNLLPGIFLPQLKKLVEDADLRAKMSAASQQFYVPDAADKIAQAILIVGVKS